MKYSIVTCVYNSEKYLQNNIKSVRNQTYTNYEHIFIDSNSTDRTLELIKNYERETPGGQVRLFQTKQKGISRAMNEGIKYASGDFLIHLHSDDSFFDSNVLEDVNNYIYRNQDMDWLYGKINVVEEDGKNVGIFPDRKIFQYNSDNIFGKYLLKFINFIPHQAVFIKKVVFEEFGYFDETIKCYMDPDMWVRIKNDTNWKFYDRIMSNYCIRKDAQSSGEKNTNENLEYKNTVQKRYMNFFECWIAKLINFLVSKINKTSR